MEVEKEEKGDSKENLFISLLKQKENDQKSQNENVYMYQFKQFHQLRQQDSLAVVLLQALYNNDKQLLNFCLYQQDEQIIERTISKLIPQKVPILLQKLIEKMNSVPNITNSLSIWLKYLIKYHIAVIMTNQTLSRDIEKLLQVIQNSTKKFQNLIKVKGKIDMLIGCIGQQQTDVDKDYTLKKQKPLILIEVQEEEENIHEQEESIIQEQDNVSEQQNGISDSVSDSEEEKLDKQLAEAYKNMVVEEDDEVNGIQSDSLDEFIGIDEEAQQ